ncbi:hypothetical protein AMK29_20745 [Streptomyces sp. CB02261]|nr:hypothetical protein AMK29_20745 [Streptomyces sp. CB02261]
MEGVEDEPLADSGCRTVASSVAVFRLSSSSRKAGAFEPIPYRASPAIRAAGTTDTGTRCAPSPRPLQRRPHPRRQKPAHLRLRRELSVGVRAPDLPRVLIPALPPRLVANRP